MLMTGLASADAERAFTQASRARRWAALKRRLRRAAGCGCLRVYDELALRHAGMLPQRGLREIPLDAITGTLEPSKARLFDDHFRPAAAARPRWQRVWLAEQRGAVLPPIDVVQIRGGYVVRDGHHRLSVARARGGSAIDAVVGAP
jgi:hypothetical protein